MAVDNKNTYLFLNETKDKFFTTSNITKILSYNKLKSVSLLRGTRWEKLESLYLICNNIFDIRGLAAVHMPKLSCLYLTCCNIKHIAALLDANFPKLRILYIGYNRIENPEKMEKQLREKFPNCNIFISPYNPLDDLYP